MISLLVAWLLTVLLGGYAAEERFAHPAYVPIVVSTSFDRVRAVRYDRCEAPARTAFVAGDRRVTVSVRGRYDLVRRVELRNPIDGRAVVRATIPAGARAWRVPRVRPVAFTLVVRAPDTPPGMVSLIAPPPIGSGNASLYYVKGC